MDTHSEEIDERDSSLRAAQPRSRARRNLDVNMHEAKRETPNQSRGSTETSGSSSSGGDTAYSVATMNGNVKLEEEEVGLQAQGLSSSTIRSDVAAMTIT